ncbi:MAG: bifunctional glutamate N-acetyltransferase/amino-acid acetyltransferase ArgJ [Deltaproteobacteria bacterium]|jgi:glutamate N-acetyltransferase/amino-acid N-acetyltransferase|nr:bifunctional glutamate N-acetyltransferase/amino-acid acetyltransferase ArgJ [Deltaproteobacteria bacterium]
MYKYAELYFNPLAFDATIQEGGDLMPKGFKVSAIETGARYKKRLDLGLIKADKFCGGAAVFTRNICRAAPILWSVDKVDTGSAILVNAGQANAQTGDKGLYHCESLAETLAPLLGLKTHEVLLASTGVIGVPLNIEAITSALDALVKKLGDKGFCDFASAIMTTDTKRKAYTAIGTLPNGTAYQVNACAKGSGMIAPNMGTMLAFILTDLKITSEALTALLEEVTLETFNRITVDGDTSTNDSVFIMSSGAVDTNIIDDPNSKEALSFKGVLYELMMRLALDIVADAEGGTKVVRILVQGATTAQEADSIARTIANSNLVKTAFYGEDPNWGRILAAMGRSGAFFHPIQVSLDLDAVPWVRNGLDNGKDEEAKKVLKKDYYTLKVTLTNGYGERSIWTSDLSLDYVKINSSYKS